MGNNFELIKSAFENITSSPKFSLKDFCGAVKPVARAYGCACITCEIPIKRGERQTIVIYGEEAYAAGVPEGALQVRFEGSPNAGGKTVITCVCAQGRVWSDEEISDLNFICRMANVLSEKIRLGAMADNYFYCDTGTGLYNLNGLTRFAASLVRRGVADGYCAAFLNLIGYNYVNKKVGYKVGNKLLKQYGVKFRALLDKDELIARMGGDNFVVFFKKENTEKIVGALKGIPVKCRYNSGEVRFVIEARAGIYSIDEPDKPFDKIINYISATLNYAKYYARTNIVYYTKEIERRVLEYKEYVQSFRRGIENEEFFVVYQPKVYTENNTLYGGEALVRWNCGGKVIYPGEFVQILEHEHLISILDFYVLEHTCRDLRKWIDSGIKPVKISVNFSNDHLWDEELIEHIVEIVDRYGIDHSLIEIEMTETVDVNEIQLLLKYVDGLHANGFTVAMDDFGTGYSSLQILQNVCVDVLKIDKTFVTEVAEDKDRRDNIILKHIINMARELGVEIVAEGVETGDQRENLSEMNCHRIQGYVYDKPLSESDFKARLSAGNYSAV